MDPLTIGSIAYGIGQIGNWYEGRRAQQLTGKEAQRERKWQARMRATQYQTTVKDMRAAGINPALALSRGGAGNLSGASPSYGAADAPGGSSALEAAAFKKNLQLLDEQIAKTEAEALTATRESEMALFKRDQERERYKYYFEADGRPKGPLAELLRNEHASRMASTASDVVGLESLRLSIPEQKAIADLFSRGGGAAKVMQYLLPILSRATPTTSRVIR